jgi:hypothetical protein
MLFPQWFQNHVSPKYENMLPRGTLYNFCLEI